MLAKQISQTDFILDVHLWHNCNLSCKFCFAPRDIFTDGIDIASFNDFMKDLNSSFFTTLSFVGGDSLFHKNTFFSVMENAVANNFKINLCTNGTLLGQSDFDTILPWLNYIQLPIDEISAIGMGKMRNAEYLFEKQLANIKTINKNLYFKGKIKITTVATKINYDNIPYIPNVLSERDLSINVWRLFQFKPIGRGRKYSTEFSISNTEFQRLLDQINSKTYPFSFQPSWNYEKSLCIDLLPDGYFYWSGSENTGFNLKTFDPVKFEEKYSDRITLRRSYLANLFKHNPS